MPILHFDYTDLPFNEKKSADFPIVVYSEQGTDCYSPPYRIDYYEFGILLEGSLELTVGINTYLIKQYDAVCIGPGLIRRWGKLPAPVKSFRVFFENSFLLNNGIPLNLQERFAFFRFNADNVIQLSPPAVQEIKHEMQSLQLDIQARYARLAAARLWMVMELLNVAYSSPPEYTGRKKQYSNYTNRFLELLYEKHLDWHFVQQYADHLFIPSKYLTKLVSNELGHPPKYWINALLMLGARSRLLHTDQSIQEIAAELGYRDVYQFSKVFKTLCGSSPGEFRKRSFDKRKRKKDK